MPSSTLSRRALIAGTGTVLVSSVLAIPYVSAARASEVCSASTSEETVTDRIERLSHALSVAMGEYDGGNWRISVAAGDDITLQPRATGSASHRANTHLKNYFKAMMEADPTILSWDVTYDIEAGRLRSVHAIRHT